MGFIFRKSIGVGPFRVNLSKSGVGYSVGGMGVRTGVSAKGKKYTSFGVPGTGLSYRTSKGPGKALPQMVGAAKGLAKGGKGCLGMLMFALVTTFGVLAVGGWMMHATALLTWLK
jgi:hypothetical protein